MWDSIIFFLNKWCSYFLSDKFSHYLIFPCLSSHSLQDSHIWNTLAYTFAGTLLPNILHHKALPVLWIKNIVAFCFKLGRHLLITNKATILFIHFVHQSWNLSLLILSLHMIDPRFLNWVTCGKVWYDMSQDSNFHLQAKPSTCLAELAFKKLQFMFLEKEYYCSL